VPWKLIPPRPPHTKYWYIRGKYCGISLDRSTGTGDERAAKRIIATWRQQAERGEFKHKEPEPERSVPTFEDAALAYMKAGGERQFIEPILRAWPGKALDAIDQVAIDTLAEQLYPSSPASTRNRQVYTPVSAVLKHVGRERKIKRPKGWRGNKRTFWLKPEPTFALLAAATAIDAEFGIFCTLLNYTGLRLSEALALTVENVDLSRGYAYVPDTKTDTPRAVHLPPVCVTALANHPRGLSRRDRLFRFHSGQRLDDRLRRACEAAGIALPTRTLFHLFRHNYGTWMRLYGGLDGLGLIRTGVWADMDSVERYSHSETSAEARRANDLPTPGRGADVDEKTGSK
jgi:integrase